MGCPKWTPEENEILSKWYPEYGPSWHRWPVLLPGRTYRAIVKQAARLGVSSRYRGPMSWTKVEDRMAVAMLAEVCRNTGRSPNAVINRLAHLVRVNKKKHREKEESCASKS